MRQTCIFSGSSHPHLVEAICDRLGQKRSQVELKKFSNGETSVEIKTSVRDQDVFIVQSGSDQINDNVMEMLIMISACKGGSARSITAVMPYFPYSRQSKKKSHRGAITARMLANLMKVAGVDHVITVDLHASQMQGFFKCPVDNLFAEPILAKWIKMHVPEWWDSVVVSKNPGGTKRVTSLADKLSLSFGIVTTERRKLQSSRSMYNSVILESLGGDGTNERGALEKEAQQSRTHSPSRQQRRAIHARSRVTSRAATEAHALLTTSAFQSELHNGIHEDDQSSGTEPAQTVPYPPSSNDEDGYEEPDNGDNTDERPQDVITGRLMNGHIVDDDEPSMSISQASDRRGHRHPSEDDEVPGHMTESFMSTASSRFVKPSNFGLGGTADATHSDEEEEEALQNPDIETHVTLVGNVRDKAVIIVDDMIDKAGSWIAAAETVVKRGNATKVYCMATHALFGGDSLRQLDQCPEIHGIIVTNAFPIPDEKRLSSKKLIVLDISSLLAEAIRRNHHGESISHLYFQFD